jgi:hypothetical protein
VKVDRCIGGHSLPITHSDSDSLEVSFPPGQMTGALHSWCELVTVVRFYKTKDSGTRVINYFVT